MMCSNVFAKLPRTRPQVERRAPMMHTTLVPHLQKASLSISLPSSEWRPYLDTSLDANGPVKAYVATIALPTPDTFQQRPSVLQTFIYKCRKDRPCCVLRPSQPQVGRGKLQMCKMLLWTNKNGNLDKVLYNVYWCPRCLILKQAHHQGLRHSRKPRDRQSSPIHHLVRAALVLALTPE